MHLAITLCFLATFVATGSSELCETKWPTCGVTIKNIVCERDEKCDAEEGCEKMEPDPELLKWILHEHNRLRNEIATGKESRGFTGAAANMMALSYDKDLEFTASCNANRCKFEHDKCRGTAKFPAAGQNLFYASGNGSELRQAVTDWFEEIKLSTADVIDKFPRDRGDISRFTQLIWATTTHIGCASAKKTGSDEHFLVCNYGPSGNLEDQTVYERGEGCSKCPADLKSNSQYPALCGEIDQSALGPGTGESGVPHDKDVGVTEKADDKDAAAAGGGAAGAGVPAAGAPGLGGLGGLGGPPGSQAEQDKKDQDDKEKKTTKQDGSTQRTDESKQGTGSTITTGTSTTVASTNASSAQNTTIIYTSTVDPRNYTTVNATVTGPSGNTTSKPDSGYVDKSSKLFIFSIASVLVGYWFLM